MLARLYVQLPFSITVPEKTQFPLYNCVVQGYAVRFYPPKKSKEAPKLDGGLSINGISAYQADLLHVNFYKDDFDRRVSASCDPPEALIRDVTNLFLVRLRIVTQSHLIRPIDFPFVSWNLQYLNDDESELEEAPGLLRGRFGRRFDFSWTALTPEIWKDVHTLPADYTPPHWYTLLLDANAAMPDVGLSIVLAVTALEVFISHILNQLAVKSTIPTQIWTWINARRWPLKDPDLEEQFDKLLKILGGFSLKDDNNLWKALDDLKDARNKFVHEGKAMIKSKPVSEDEARSLVTKAKEIVAYIRGKLPADLQWPEFKHSVEVKFSQKLFGDGGK